MPPAPFFLYSHPSSGFAFNLSQKAKKQFIMGLICTSLMTNYANHFSMVIRLCMFFGEVSIANILNMSASIFIRDIGL